MGLRPFLAAAFALSSVAVAADDDFVQPPKVRLYYDSFTAARYNPLGLQQTVGLYGRVRLFDSTSILFRDTYVMAGPVISISPASAQPGFRIQALPIALLRLGARLDYIRYFGTFKQLMVWSEPKPDWSESGIDLLAAQDANRSEGGQQWTLDARLQAQVGPIAARFTFTAQGAFLHNPEAGDVGYYDQGIDAYVPVRGWTFLHDTDLLYVPDDKPYVIGARWTATDPVLDGGHPTTHRVGPLFAWKFADKSGPRFANPALLVIAQFHAKHPFRTGVDVSAAIPYLVVAFAFDGDLIPW